ncbi:hypothetical protein [Flavihumibacter sp. CACIAM 22H1]|uniref:hypothetical protein n=1 Tax=Flavihumibacter sp. CACIAM 22H1 TaxID=1812911 RepID=UPI0025B92BF9|nr:hypothetical protein [Flavihumibacter sp. CACIAM 22H1]
MKPILIYILSLFSLWACKGSRSAELPAREEKKMRILGYYHSSANWLIRDISDQLPLLTDLNLAFVNPDQDGKRLHDYSRSF